MPSVPKGLFRSLKPASSEDKLHSPVPKLQDINQSHMISTWALNHLLRHHKRFQEAHLIDTGTLKQQDAGTYCRLHPTTVYAKERRSVATCR
jgi:hypothetical protein